MKNKYKTHWDMSIAAKKHFSAYNHYNFKGFNHHNDLPYLLSNEYPLTQTLLKKSRDIPEELIEDLNQNELFYTNDLNKLSLLDYIVPFYNNYDKLQKSLRIKYKVKHFEIKKKVEKYFNYDLLLTTEEEEKIAVKWMYLDLVNDNKTLNLNTHKLFYGKSVPNSKSVDYSKINDLMENPINPYIFKKFRLFWLYIYHQFVVSDPNLNYVLFCFPKFNQSICKQTSEFMHTIKHENKFKYANKVFIRHIEDIVNLNHEYQGRYIFFEPSRFNVRMELDTYWHSKELEEYKKHENIKPLNSVNELRINSNKIEFNAKIIKQVIVDGTKRIIVSGKEYLKVGAILLDIVETEEFKNYAIDNFDRFVHKEYQNDIDIVILMYDLE